MGVILFNKPFDVLCQFTDERRQSDDNLPPRKTLADYIDQPGFYAAGRLDRDSEGLLVLTDDGKLQHRISHPDYKEPKEYVVQVEGDLDNSAIKTLCEGVLLKDGMTKRALAVRINEPDWLWPRTPPIRTRRSIPTSWVRLSLTEGKNRQIRRMTAAVGFPTLRLIRTGIANWTVDGLSSGEWTFSKTS